MPSFALADCTALAFRVVAEAATEARRRSIFSLNIFPKDGNDTALLNATRAMRMIEMCGNMVEEKRRNDCSAVFLLEEVQLSLGSAAKRSGKN